jgi:hypothetical protein
MIDYAYKTPHHAVCCWVLNLQEQVRVLLGSAALTEVYRIASASWAQNLFGVGSKRVCNIANTVGLTFLYHKRKRMYRPIP